MSEPPRDRHNVRIDGCGCLLVLLGVAAIIVALAYAWGAIA